MRTLSFDTSAGVLHLCLMEDKQPVYERTIEPKGAQRQEVASLLMQEIDNALRQSLWAKSSLDLIVTGVGPGSFTGIRVAVITGRTLADVLKLPLMGVSSLESAYYAACAQDAAGVVLGTTSRLFFYGAFQRTQDDPAKPVVEPGFGLEAEVKEKLAPYKLFADPQALSAFSAEPLILKNIALSQACLAYDRLSLKELLKDKNDGNHELADSFPWQSVLPLYLRSPSITLKPKNAAANPQND